MDIHVPNEPVMTWKQFFVHMAIVVLGVLIAIALEQTVEWMHHRHQLHELREGLNQDAQKAMRDADSVIAAQTAIAANIHENALAARDAAQNHKTFQPQRGPRVQWEIPSDPAWKAAKASGLVSLLRPDEVQAFGEIDSMIDLSDHSVNDAIAASENLNAVVGQFQSNGHSDYSSATPEELRQIATLAEHQRAARLTWVRMATQLKGAERAILAGDRDLERIERAEQAELDKPSK
ncbi:MAG TPA: hypothetical protein VGM11_15080 [Acidobacteriaceae bacterium]|jgi:hypothetical protein